MRFYTYSASTQQIFTTSWLKGVKHQNELTAANKCSRTENCLIWISHVAPRSDPLIMVIIGAHGYLTPTHNGCFGIEVKAAVIVRVVIIIALIWVSFFLLNRCRSVAGSLTDTCPLKLHQSDTGHIWSSFPSLLHGHFGVSVALAYVMFHWHGSPCAQVKSTSAHSLCITHLTKCPSVHQTTEASHLDVLRGHGLCASSRRQPANV